jgi:hypothetical protein
MDEKLKDHTFVFVTDDIKFFADYKEYWGLKVQVLQRHHSFEVGNAFHYIFLSVRINLTNDEVSQVLAET